MLEEIAKNRFRLALKIILFITLLAFIYFIHDILLLFAASIIIAFIFMPIIDWFENKKIPRYLGAILVYLVFLLIIVGILFLIIPSLISEIYNFSQRFFDYFQITQRFLNSIQSFLPVNIFNLQTWQQALTNLSQNLISFIGTLISGFFSFLLVAVISFYLIVEKKSFTIFFKKFIPEKYQRFVSNLVYLSQEDLSRWGLALLFSMFFVGILTYLGLSMLGIHFALALAAIALLCEIVPRFGAVIGAIPAVVIALFESPLKAIMVIVFYILVQQLNHVIVLPQIMKKAVGLNPIVVVLVIFIGAKIGGVFGGIIAIPITTVIIIFINEYLKLKKQVEIQK